MNTELELKGSQTPNHVFSLTGEPITIFNKDESILTVIDTYTYQLEDGSSILGYKVDYVTNFITVTIDDIPVHECRNKLINLLPKQTFGIFFVVDPIIARMFPERTDFLSGNDPVVGSEDDILGYKSLVSITHSR